MTPNEFKRKLRDAKKGDVIRYFRGFTGDLMRNHDPVRRAAAKAYIDGLVTLAQKRTGVAKNYIVKGEEMLAYEYDYLAVKL